MGVFDRFRKDKGSTVTVSESDEPYFKEERFSRRTSALILGVATFITTLIIGSALFFGGRAIYRAVFDDEANNTTQTETATEDQEAQPAPSGNTNQTDGQDGEDGQDVTQPPRRNSGAPATGDSMPTTGDQPALPATGDPGM